jgi:hypothetical protein
MHPFDGATPSERLSQTIQAVSNDPEDLLDTCLLHDCYDEIGDVVDRHQTLPDRHLKKIEKTPRDKLTVLARGGRFLTRTQVLPQPLPSMGPMAPTGGADDEKSCGHVRSSRDVFRA